MWCLASITSSSVDFVVAGGAGALVAGALFVIVCCMCAGGGVLLSSGARFFLWRIEHSDAKEGVLDVACDDGV